jgi:hypothetical protein
MKNSRSIFIVFVIALLLSQSVNAQDIFNAAQQSNFPKLTGPYLGQKPPGDETGGSGYG